MQFIFMAVILCVTLAAMVFVKTLDLGVGLTATLVIPLVLLAIYGLAKVQTNEPDAKKDASKITHH